MKSKILRQTLLMNFSFLEWAVRPMQSFTRHDNGNALPAELSRKFLKMTSQLRAALRTFSMLGERVVADLVPVAHDQRMLASRTVRGAARKVVYVASIHMQQSGRVGDLPCLGQRFRRGAGNAGHLVVGVESGEVQRHVHAEFPGDPFAHLADFVR